MTGFDPDTEKVVQESAGMADGSIVTIEKRVPLDETELAAVRASKVKAMITALENKILAGTMTSADYASLDGLYKINQMNLK